jgi:glucose/mannose transport system substrate-binding protein
VQRWSTAILSALLLGAAAGCNKSNTVTLHEDSSPVEVMHWLTSGRDAAALAVVRDALRARGGQWTDTPMPGAGETGRAAAVNRILGGQPPDVFQFSLGSQLEELAARRQIAPVPGPTSSWRSIYPPVIDAAARHAGLPFAVPLDVRGENWLFYNAAVLQAMSIDVPRTWPQLLLAASRLKAAGKIPIALGGQPWQERLLFNAVLLGIGGRTFYRRVYGSLDPAALESARMLEVFQTFGALRSDVDPGSPGRRWNATTQLLTRGEAAFQIMGDWAKSEILAAGLTPGREIGCALAPADEEAYIMMVDVFAFARAEHKAALAGQLLFALTVEDLDVQAEFARRLGAIPARMDVPATGFDSCSTQAMSVVRDPDAQLMDPGLILPGGVSGAIDDAISRFWNDSTLNPAQGRALLRDAVRSYQ